MMIISDERSAFGLWICFNISSPGEVGTELTDLLLLQLGNALLYFADENI